jgi:phospho-N-acetylmuramoyl-pentapeptide-transferase
MWLPGYLISISIFIGILMAFGATVLALAKFSRFLPKDGGREFAHEGEVSVGKPRGAGLIFIIVFSVFTFLFAPVDWEIAIYLGLIICSMLAGYFDDAANSPWRK